MEKLVEEDAEPQRPPPRPRPRRKAAAAAAAAPTDDEEENHADQAASESELDPATTPKAKPRQRRAKAATTYNTKTPRKSPAHTPPVEELEEDSPRLAPLPDHEEGSEPVTPAKSRKRARSEEAEDAPEEREVTMTNGSVASKDGILEPQSTPAGDVQVRRKRIRH